MTATRFADRMIGQIRDSELLVFKGVRTAPIYEKIEEFNQKTLRFLQRHARAGTAVLAGTVQRQLGSAVSSRRDVLD